MKFPVYNIEIEFTTDCSGGCPNVEDLITDFIDSVRYGTGNALRQAIKEEGEVSDASIARFLRQCTNLHYRDASGPYISSHALAAALRVAAESIGIVGAKTGALHKVLTNGVMLPERLRFTPSETHFIQRAIQPFHHGVRNPSVGAFEVVKRGAKMAFPLAVLNEKELPRDRLRLLLETAGVGGLGAARNIGYGRFRVTLFKNGRYIDSPAAFFK